MNPKLYIYSHFNHLNPRTAIARVQKQFIQIAFAVHLSAVISAERYRSDSGALKSAVLHFVFFVMLKNKIEQSAKRNSLLKKPTDRTFENRWSRYKELGKKVPQAYRVYVEDTFLPCDAGDARIFSKEHEHGLRVSKHIFVGNSRLVTAMTHEDNHGDTTEQTEKRYYYHADHLQSAQFITNAKGEQYEHIEYTPYGELWTYKSKTAMLFLTTYNNFLAKQPAGLIEETAPGIDKLPFRFTGKELDEETGLYYYGARYLDPKYSRWLSGYPALGDYISKDYDGVSGGIYNTTNLNVYHYGGNNPITYTDPDGREIENLDPSKEAKLLENIINVAGTGFYFENNKLKFDSSSKASGKYSQTARDILIAGIASSKTTYVLPASPEKIQELLPDAYGELGFARRVSGEPGNTVGVYMIDVPTTQVAIDYLNNTFNCTPSEADELGFIHEVLGHAICDMGIPGYNSKTDIMKIERKIRAELGWKGVSRTLEHEEADLTDLFFRIRK